MGHMGDSLPGVDSYTLGILLVFSLLKVLEVLPGVDSYTPGILLVFSLLEVLRSGLRMY
jgi:hypothetical protein